MVKKKDIVLNYSLIDNNNLKCWVFTKINHNGMFYYVDKFNNLYNKKMELKGFIFEKEHKKNMLLFNKNKIFAL